MNVGGSRFAGRDIIICRMMIDESKTKNIINGSDKFIVKIARKK